MVGSGSAAEDIERRLLGCLGPPPRFEDLCGAGPSGRGQTLAGDHTLGPVAAPAPAVIRPAAVLVPIVLAPDRRAGAKVLFTRRTESLPRHSGQVSFPGGAIDPEDADVVSGALREVQEEIGVDPAQVRVLGALDIYLTITGYAVAPLVGLLAPGFSLAPDAREVAEVFEVPLAFLLDRTNYRQAGGVFNGIARRWWIIEYGRHHIWGATAGILHNLVQRIDADGPKP